MRRGHVRVPEAYSPVDTALEPGLDRTDPFLTRLPGAAHEKANRLLVQLHLMAGESVAPEEPRPDMSADHRQPGLERRDRYLDQVESVEHGSQHVYLVRGTDDHARSRVEDVQVSGASSSKSQMVGDALQVLRPLTVNYHLFRVHAACPHDGCFRAATSVVPPGNDKGSARQQV